MKTPFSFRVLLSSALLLLATGSLAASPLANTDWQLVAIQSMDDAQGTTKIADPSRFTVHFGADGRASFRLDCNRGTGTYKVEPAADGSSGSLAFGPVAATHALCPPPHVDERVARDLAYVRSYLLKDGKLYLSLMADGGIYEWASVKATAAAQNDDRVIKPVQFGKGKSSTVIRDRIVGRQYIDYKLQAAAGQRMTVSLKGSNGANYFNLLPPDSVDVGMFNGTLGGNRFNGLLPDDGVYTVRVYLMRSAARRNEVSNFTLSVGVTGTPLKPVSAKTDAVLPGTRYHASATTQCEPQYSKARECEVFVVRRGFDGTATVELRWDADRKRRILFVKGEPKAADASQPMSFTRNERGWTVRFGDDERFEIPEPLVFGG
ncbi:MAG: META domain-containing protein [Anderseniella sp.]|jgi:heat shock protein HslJ|nr:META domain-containing protein [Anderseniella sp.]